MHALSGLRHRHLRKAGLARAGPGRNRQLVFFLDFVSQRDIVILKHLSSRRQFCRMHALIDAHAVSACHAGRMIWKIAKGN
jgi:hypothetical protein